MDYNNGNDWNDNQWNNENGWQQQTPPPFQRQPIFYNGFLNRTVLKSESRIMFRQNYGTVLAATILPSIIAAGVVAIPLIGGILSWLFAPILYIGGYYVVLGIIRNHNFHIGNMFDIFDNFGNVFGASFTTNLFLFLWSLCLVIPAGIILGIAGFQIEWSSNYSGPLPVPTDKCMAFILLVCLICCIPAIYKTFCWTMVPFLLADNPHMTGTQARHLSADMMNGHKWEYFVMIFSFIGWFILSACTLGLLGLFYVNPWVMTATCDYYDNLRMLYEAQHQQPETETI